MSNISDASRYTGSRTIGNSGSGVEITALGLKSYLYNPNGFSANVAAEYSAFIELMGMANINVVIASCYIGDDKSMLNAIQYMLKTSNMSCNVSVNQDKTTISQTGKIMDLNNKTMTNVVREGWIKINAEGIFKLKVMNGQTGNIILNSSSENGVTPENK
jgi:hypothetical protein